MKDLELAEKLMKLYRDETGDQGHGDEDDLRGLVHLVWVWAEEAGLEYLMHDLVDNK